MDKNANQDGRDSQWETYHEVETLNNMIPVWQRNKSEVTTEDLNSFYREKFFDFEDPLKTIRVDAKGRISYKALLVIPTKPAIDYYAKNYKIRLTAFFLLRLDHGSLRRVAVRLFPFCSWRG